MEFLTVQGVRLVLGDYKTRRQVIPDYLEKGSVILGSTLKLLGQPTPFFAQEEKTVNTIRKANTLASTFN